MDICHWLPFLIGWGSPPRTLMPLHFWDALAHWLNKFLLEKALGWESVSTWDGTKSVCVLSHLEMSLTIAAETGGEPTVSGTWPQISLLQEVHLLKVKGKMLNHLTLLQRLWPRLQKLYEVEIMVLGITIMYPEFLCLSFGLFLIFLSSCLGYMVRYHFFVTGLRQGHMTCFGQYNEKKEHLGPCVTRKHRALWWLLMDR